LWPVARRKLTQINRVRDLVELRIPPGNRLESLRGDRSGQHSIRINDQYRVCFRWERDMPTRSKSPITTKTASTATLVQRRLPTHRPPTHPGEMLLEEFLLPLGITQSAFALQLGVSFPRLNEVINGRRAVTPDTALRLARVTGMSADFWLGLQQDWDLWHAMRSDEAAEIDQLEPLPR
jgi:addiction module HigA family antidote